MSLFSGIKEKLKIFLTDLRRNLGLLVIISIIWLMLLFGILFFKIYVGPLEPIPSIYNYFDSTFVNLMTGTVQVLLAGSYVLIWLYLWYKLIQMYFWRTIKKHYPSSENPPEESE